MVYKDRDCFSRSGRARRGCSATTSSVVPEPNQVWSYDFVFDRCANGQ
jgi:hypothetical protein